MWALILAFVDVALHRRGPQDLPRSEFLLGLVLAAYIVVSAAALVVISADQTRVQLFALELIVDLGFVYVLLRVFEKSGRFMQTATALIGTGVLLNFISLPLLQWDELLGTPVGELNTPRMLLLLLLVWSFDIAGFIVSKALAKPYIVGVSIMVVYEIASMAMQDSLLSTAG